MALNSYACAPEQSPELAHVAIHQALQLNGYRATR